MFEAESHPLPLHALNRMKSDLCLLMLQSWNSAYGSSCFKQIESCAMSLMLWTGWKLTCGSSCLRLKPTLCLVMLWTRWNLSCASSCFKAETRHVSLDALNRLKVDLCLFMFETESHPMSLHALNKNKFNLCLLMLQSWNSAYGSSCFKQIESCAMSLMLWTGRKLTCGSSCLRLKVTLCLFMLFWTRWNLTCASSCFKTETRHVSLHALNRLKLVLCPSCFEQAESWPVALHVWGWKSPYISSCFEQDEI